MDLFGNDDSFKIQKIKADSKAAKRELKQTFRQLNRDENCLNALKDGIPNENEVQSFVSRGLSDAGSFLYAISEIEGVIDELIIATWTISKVNVRKLLEYIDNGKIKNLTFLINDGLLKTNSTKPIYAFLCLEFDKRKDKIKFAVANSHAKIQLYKISNKYLTISGSGNWSENPRIENYILIGGKTQFEFNKQWISELM